MKTEDFKNIENQVNELEKLSSIEFVPVFAKQSESYCLIRFLWAIAFALSSAYSLNQLWISPMLFYGIPIGVGFFVYFFIFKVPFLFDLFTLDRSVLRSIERAAKEEFLKHEVFATQDRTGVLIYISNLERKVYVFADKGLATKTKDSEWTELGAELAKTLGDSKNVAHTFSQALTQISKKHAADFPPKSENPNELENKPRTRH